MESEVDTSILNSVNIKRFTQSVLEEYGADIDQSNSAKWEVNFPSAIADKLDREQGTLVFDAADRELGAGDLLVEPGTRAFSALLEIVQQPGSIGRLRLTEDSLQVNPPGVLRESDLNVEVTDFSKRTSDFALTFHFRVQFETPSSFHNEEMFSVTVDPDTQTRLPELTARLTSHLPQLLQQNNEHSSRDVSQPEVQEAFEEAQQAVIDGSRPIISDIREDADQSASERIGEISDWYEQRREELDEQLKDKKSEVRKWKKKRRNARKDSTRRKYVRNRKEAEEELDQLQREVERKKQELDEEESEEIDEVIERNEVNVEVSLLGVTEVTYVRGTLGLELNSGHVTTDIEVSYLPATDEFHGLDCHVCSQDLTDGILPQLCVNGHIAGDPCTTSCRNCGLAYCTSCESNSQFSACLVCWEDICHDCVVNCNQCDSGICDTHHDVCTSCGDVTCHLCGEECSTCGEFNCDTHLSYCTGCDEYHCQDHLFSCNLCESVRCDNHIDTCTKCGELVCSEHRDNCTTCGDVVCDQHTEFCTICSYADDTQRGFCSEHSVYCSVGGETLCSDHRIPVTLGQGYVCAEHRQGCSTCKIEYSETKLTDGQCSACQSIGEVDPEHIPTEISDEFRSVKAGGNNAFMIILGKKLLGRNQLVIYNLQTGEEISRHSAGMLKQLMGEI
jgi:hypothetical protein